MTGSKERAFLEAARKAGEKRLLLQGRAHARSGGRRPCHPVRPTSSNRPRRISAMARPARQSRLSHPSPPRLSGRTPSAEALADSRHSRPRRALRFPPPVKGQRNACVRVTKQSFSRLAIRQQQWSVITPPRRTLMEQAIWRRRIDLRFGQAESRWRVAFSACSSSRTW